MPGHDGGAVYMSRKDSNLAPGPCAQYCTGELGKKGEHWLAGYDTRQLPRSALEAAE